MEALHFVPRSVYEDVLAGAEEKTKTYRVVCWVSHPVTEAFVVQRLSAINDLALDQQTPLRVLHRRTSMTRGKVLTVERFGATTFRKLKLLNNCLILFFVVVSNRLECSRILLLRLPVTCMRLSYNSFGTDDSRDSRHQVPGPSLVLLGLGCFGGHLHQGLYSCT